ncbi:hypothetical protein OG21DRAFT_1606963 [Imleria badia]|nr:hypothetical protein OG21DRAFT_1606963 [Imleria badia]
MVHFIPPSDCSLRPPATCHTLSTVRVGGELAASATRGAEEIRWDIKYVSCDWNACYPVALAGGQGSRTTRIGSLSAGAWLVATKKTSSQRRLLRVGRKLQLPPVVCGHVRDPALVSSTGTGRTERCVVDRGDDRSSWGISQHHTSQGQQELADEIQKLSLLCHLPLQAECPAKLEHILVEDWRSPRSDTDWSNLDEAHHDSLTVTKLIS